VSCKSWLHFFGFSRQAVPVSTAQIIGLSCDCCSGARAGGGFLNSYQSFLSHITEHFNPLTTLFKMVGVTEESLDEGESRM